MKPGPSFRVLIPYYKIKAYVSQNILILSAGYVNTVCNYVQYNKPIVIIWEHMI